MKPSKSVYRSNNLPHLHPKRATYSIVLVLKDAIPTAILDGFNEEKKAALNKILEHKKDNWRQNYLKKKIYYDLRFDALLRRHANQSHALADPEFAKILIDKLRLYNGVYYDLYSYSVMSNHVHMELDFSVQNDDSNYVPLQKVIQLIKGGSSFEINKLRGTRGERLWPRRYRDRFIRGERHLMNAWRYTLENPVKAGLVSKVNQHPFTGGMDESEIRSLAWRRVYPSAKFWYELLEEYDSKQAS